MGKKQYLVKLPRDLHEQVKRTVDYISQNTEDPKDRLICRQILRKIPDPPRKDSVIDFVQMQLSPQEARIYNDIIESAELPGRLKAMEIVR